MTTGFSYFWMLVGIIDYAFVQLSRFNLKYTVCIPFLLRMQTKRFDRNQLALITKLAQQRREPQTVAVSLVLLPSSPPHPSSA